MPSDATLSALLGSHRCHRFDTVARCFNQLDRDFRFDQLLDDGSDGFDGSLKDGSSDRL